MLDATKYPYEEALGLDMGLFFIPLKFMRIVEFAAVRAFRGFSIALLERLADKLGLRYELSERPIGKRAWQKVCVQHALPSASPDDIEEILGQADGEDSDAEEGGDAPVSRVGLFEKVDHHSLLSGVVAQDDIEELSKAKNKINHRAQRKLQRERDEREAKTKGKAKSKAKGKSSSSSAPSRKRKLAHDGTLELPENQSLEHYSAFLPQVHGCTMSVQTMWHTRWRVSYPNFRPPFTKACNFEATDPKSIHNAVVSCIRWCWKMHVENDGQTCPWELNDA